MTPSERVMRSRLAAHASWARTPDTAKRMKPALEGQMRRFEAQVDPDGMLAPDERRRRAESARKAHMTRLALLSAQARRKRAS